MSSENTAEWRNARKVYGSVVALHGLDLVLKKGLITALLGPNGAGKTTAIRLLLGLAKPTSGEVVILGGSPQSQQVRAQIGAMMQNGQVPETLTVSEQFDLFRSYFPKPMALNDLLELTGLGPVANRLFGKLSGGQKQRVLFGLAMAGDPQFLLLDEPTVGMDVNARRQFWDEIRELKRQGRTILITTHYLEEAQALADRVAVLDEGRLLADTTALELRNRFGRKRVCFASQSISLSDLKGQPGVHSPEGNEQRWTLLCDQPEQLVQWALARDPALTDLEVQALNLEEAYLALTSNQTPFKEAI